MFIEITCVYIIINTILILYNTLLVTTEFVMIIIIMFMEYASVHFVRRHISHEHNYCVFLFLSQEVTVIMARLFMNLVM